MTYDLSTPISEETAMNTCNESAAIREVQGDVSHQGSRSKSFS